MTTEQITYVRERIAEAIIARMILGENLEDATAEAFRLCNDRWPVVTAALIREYSAAAETLSA